MQRIVDERSAGATLGAIAGTLNRAGVPTARGGVRWYRSTVLAVLRSAAKDARRTIAPGGSAAPLTATTALWGGVAGPTFHGTFIGREAELSNLGTEIATRRLLTLTGTAGVGKSRLAAEAVARGMDGASPRVTGWVDLACEPQASNVARAVATALGVRIGSRRRLEQALVRHIRDQAMLIVLDNCDQVIPAVADVVSALLDHCPRVTFVVTSQSLLDVAGEREWRVSPLSLPEPAEMSHTAAGPCEAVRLFLDRAEAARPGFHNASGQPQAVAEICTRLDGIPLAIELAAARVSILTPQQIARRMHDRFPLLTTEAGDVPDRHQTLRRAVEWSYNLLPPSERRLLQRLSIFAGGCTLDAIEAVCGDEQAVIDPLAALVARSFVVADLSGSEARYRLLETIRLFAREQLRAGDAVEARSLHALWYLRVAGQAEQALCGATQLVWLDALRRDEDNLRSALSWSLDHGDGEAALRLCGALAIFWRIHGDFVEGREWCARALSRAAGTPTTRAAALWGAGLLALMAGDGDSAVVAVEEALQLAIASDDPLRRGRCLLLLANRWQAEAASAAEALFSECLAITKQSGDCWCRAHALALQAQMRFTTGDCDTARVMLGEAVSVARQANDLQSLQVALIVSGQLHVLQGELRAAEVALGEALAIARAASDPYNQSVAVEWLGEVAMARGAYSLASDLYSEALLLVRRAGSTEFSVLCGLGQASLALGDAAAARSYLELARSAATDPGYTRLFALLRLGELADACGDHAEAASLTTQALDIAVGRIHQSPAELARALDAMGAVLRRAGEPSRAARHHHRALGWWHECGDHQGAVSCLEALGGLAAVGRAAWAARLFGAAAARRDTMGSVRLPPTREQYEADVAAARAALGAVPYDAAFAEGGTMSLREAIAYAQRGRTAGTSRAAQGWDSLTRAERKVADLAAEGLTNVQIGSRLFISPHTAAGHLTRVFGKLGIASRSQLARHALSREATPEK